MATGSQILTRNKYNKAAEGSRGVSTTRQAPKNTSRKNVTRVTSQNQPEKEWKTDTVFLEPNDPLEPGLKHSLEVGRMLSRKQITGVKEVQKIGRFRFKVIFDTVEQAGKIATANLAEAGMKMYTPKIERDVIGIVKGIPKDYPEEELMDNLQATKDIIKVERVKRRATGTSDSGDLIETESVKVTFKGKDLAEYVVLYGCRIKVELYIFPLKQCTNCWMFGHKSIKCTKSRKCISCGKEHESSDCETVKCINCRGDHPAAHKSCPQRAKQKRISEVMQRHGVTRAEAISKYVKVNNRFDLLDTEDDFPELEERTVRQDERRQPNRWKTGKMKNGVHDIQNTGGNWRNSNAEKEIRVDKPEWNNPYRTNTVERLVSCLQTTWNNLGIMSKLVKLHEAVVEEIKSNEGRVGWEALFVKFTTVLTEIIMEFGTQIETTELREEQEEETNSNNGE